MKSILKKAVAGFFFLLSVCLLQAEGFCAGTLVKVPSGYAAIEQLSAGDLVICCDHENKLVTRPIYHVTKRIQNTCVQLHITDTLLCGDVDQKVYDPQKGSWICLQDINPNHTVLCAEPVTGLQKVHKQTVLYELSITEYPNFYVTQHAICAHNVVFAAPLVISVLQSTPVLVAVTKAAGVALFSTVAYLFAKKASKNNAVYAYPPGPNPPPQNKKDNNDDDDDEDKSEVIRVNNMREFFQNTQFGRDIKKYVEKTNYRHDGKAIYKVLKDIPKYKLEEGFFFYLDGLHMDHLEVFSAAKVCILVLNLTGIQNVKKTAKAFGRILKCMR